VQLLPALGGTHEQLMSSNSSTNHVHAGARL
jgi:hypothetical protein